MANTSVKAKLEDFLKHCRPEVASELTIVTPDDIGQDVLYHIAYNRQAQMGPFISKRAGLKEDNTVPRVHVAQNLRGCILGYGGVHEIASSDYILQKGDKKQTGKSAVMQNYKGGFYIHSLRFEAALRPSKKLVYDVEKTGELWLVTYSPETVFYDSPVIGKVIPISVEFFPQVGGYPSSVIKLAIEVNPDCVLRIDEKVSFGAGYCESVFEQRNNKCTHINTSVISKEKFLIHKGASADLLSRPITATHVFNKW